MRVPMDRPLRQGELQIAELLVQLGASRPEEVAIAGGNAVGCGQAGLRSPQRIEAGQLTWAVSERVEAREQAGQIHMRGLRLPAGHRVPERHRVIVHQQRLIKLLVHADRRDVAPPPASGRRTTPA